MQGSEERLRNNQHYEEQYRMQQRALEEQLNRSGVPMTAQHDMDARNPQAYPDQMMGSGARVSG